MNGATSPGVRGHVLGAHAGGDAGLADVHADLVANADARRLNPESSLRDSQRRLADLHGKHPDAQAESLARRVTQNERLGGLVYDHEHTLCCAPGWQPGGLNYRAKRQSMLAVRAQNDHCHERFCESFEHLWPTPPTLQRQIAV